MLSLKSLSSSGISAFFVMSESLAAMYVDQVSESLFAEPNHSDGRVYSRMYSTWPTDSSCLDPAEWPILMSKSLIQHLDRLAKALVCFHTSS